MAENIVPLIYWIREREAIRTKRLAGCLPPWTIDPILSEFRFCNVRRRDDRVSQWLRDVVLTQKNVDYDLRSFLLFSAWCRWCNWPPTIRAVIDEGLYPKKRINWKRVGKLTDWLSDRGKAWTGAYMIRAPDEPGASKGGFIAEQVIGRDLAGVVPKLEVLFRRTNSCVPLTFYAVWKLVCEANNFGSFMAGQVVGDWSYTSLLWSAPDLKYWAPMGPGSIRGFNRLMGNSDLSAKPSEELWLEKLADWRRRVITDLGESYEDMTALDLQNCLCETDKYLRVKLGEGRPRSRYKPHTY